MSSSDLFHDYIIKATIRRALSQSNNISYSNANPLTQTNSITSLSPQHLQLLENKWRKALATSSEVKKCSNKSDNFLTCSDAFSPDSELTEEALSAKRQKKTVTVISSESSMKKDNNKNDGDDSDSSSEEDFGQLEAVSDNTTSTLTQNNALTQLQLLEEERNLLSKQHQNNDDEDDYIPGTGAPGAKDSDADENYESDLECDDVGENDFLMTSIFTKNCDSNDCISGDFVSLKKGKNQWKIELEKGFVRIKNKEYLFKKASGIMDVELR